MLTVVKPDSKSLNDYINIIGNKEADEIRKLSEPLIGARVLHINATAFGGGVAELLNSLVPLMNDVGLNTEWQIIHGSEEFYGISKAMHNSLQGMPITWTPAMLETWKKYNRINAELFEGDYDYVIVHDPQPAGLLNFITESGKSFKDTRWIWRCHIDSTDAQPDIWNFIKPYIELYETNIFTMKQFVRSDLHGPTIWTIPPAIDPLSKKNTPMDQDTRNSILKRYGIDTTKPLLVQASRMDAWKDPLGVIEAYTQVKSELPDVQLVFLVAIADDDPEGWAYYEQAVEMAGEDPNIHILPNIRNGIGDLEVNAFQSGADIVIQKSLREGFGLSVTEALWKSRPVIGGKTGGIPLQIIHGRTGYLVSSPTECAKWILHLLKHPETSERIGAQGKRRARDRFLITRYMKDYLRIFTYLRLH